MKINILIIEDELNIRKELKMFLENAEYQVNVIDDFHHVVHQIQTKKPDLVLLDINLPNESGLSICSDLRKTSDIPIIFVTSKNTSIDELNCIMLGGDDYIAKPYNAPILLARIAAVLKRTKHIEKKEDEKITYKGLTLDVLAGTIYFENMEIELTKNELKILYYLFAHRNMLVPRVDIIEYLWDNQVFIDDNTLSVNITRIRNKLKQIGIEDFIETKRGLGYKV